MSGLGKRLIWLPDNYCQDIRPTNPVICQAADPCRKDVMRPLPNLSQPPNPACDQYLGLCIWHGSGWLRSRDVQHVGKDALWSHPEKRQFWSPFLSLSLSLCRLFIFYNSNQITQFILFQNEKKEIRNKTQVLMLPGVCRTLPCVVSCHGFPPLFFGLIVSTNLRNAWGADLQHFQIIKRNAKPRDALQQMQAMTRKKAFPDTGA